MNSLKAKKLSCRFDQVKKMYGCVTENVADGKKKRMTSLGWRLQWRHESCHMTETCLRLLPLFFLTRNSFLPFMSSFSPFALSFEFKWVNFICHKNILIANKLKKWNLESHTQCLFLQKKSSPFFLFFSSLFLTSACFLAEYLKKVNNRRYQRHSSLILDSPCRGI